MDRFAVEMFLLVVASSWHMLWMKKLATSLISFSSLEWFLDRIWGTIPPYGRGQPPYVCYHSVEKMGSGGAIL